MRFLKLLSLLAMLGLILSCSDGDSKVFSGAGRGGPGTEIQPQQQARLRLVLDFNAVANKVRLKLPSSATKARVEVYETATGRLEHQEVADREAGADTQELLIEGLTVGIKLVRTILLDSEGTVLGYSDQVVNASAGGEMRVVVSTMVAGDPPPPSFEPVVPGEAVRLVFLVHPENPTSGQTFTVEVVALDGNGQRVANASGPVTLQGPGLAPITVPMVNGVAVFSGLLLDSVENGIVLSASSGDLQPANSLPIQVQAASEPPGPARVATSLRFVTIPDVIQVAGADFEVQVEVRDQFGSRLSSGTQPVTLGLEESPSGAVLGGQATVNAVDGLATFNISLSKLGSYKLSAATTGLTGASSSGLQVRAGVATQLAFFVQPASGTAGQNLFPAPKVEVLDAYGNRVVSDPALSITLALAPNPASAQLRGNLTQTTAAAGGTDPGLATFADLRLDRSGSYSFTASAAGRESAPAILEQLERLLKADPRNNMLWARRFQAHYVLGDYKSALADSRRLEQIDGRSKWVLNNRAFVLAEMGEFEKALPDALEAAQIPPDDPGSWDTVGYCYVGLGRDEEAVEAYSRAIAHKAKPNYLWGRAVALRRLGQKEAAEADFQRARKLQPGYSQHWNLDPDPGIY